MCMYVYVNFYVKTTRVILTRLISMMLMYILSLTINNNIILISLFYNKEEV